VRGARLAAGLTQRELARRAGVAPSVISRIESGEVKRPDWSTTERIAAALGRSRAALSYTTGNMAAWLEDGFIEEIGEARVRELVGHATGEPGSLSREQKRALLEEALERFKAGTLLDHVVASGAVNDEAVDALHRIATSWPGLTERRQALAVGFVEDQLVLSELDRRGDEPQRGRA